ncbi:hypothetical protein [uncultured Azohydromonas sp.]|uniref:hypothetical protein n=1 Tax=uncultured Azohydromonas sp. TaxID=487342 RepID=UPI002639BCDD|nr:hypothetical protein [uncultured Azohydromonas sp.]
MEQVAERISKILGDPNAIGAIERHTGFTNFYSAYRNSARNWVELNSSRLKRLFKSAYALSSDDDGLRLIETVESLKGIGKPNETDSKIPASNLLTPVFFSLDQRLRFPLINGNEGVQHVLRTMKESTSSLKVQYTRMMEMYGKGGIRDAADLDQLGKAGAILLDVVGIPATPGRPATTTSIQLLTAQPTDGECLPLKDDRDFVALRAAQTIVGRRIHNRLTNQLRTCLSDFLLLEGRSKLTMFDVLVKSYDKKSGKDLIVEVKSSTDIGDIRMAVGQLYSYSYFLKSKMEPDLSVLLPEKPTADIVAWLGSRNIGLLWLDQENLYTSSKWLEEIATYAA